MKIGKVEEERTFTPRIIPITIPAKAPEKPAEQPIPAPDWPQPVKVPEKVQVR
jgi:hypothetical protein